ncbi:MAG: cytochrome c oxidase subunit 4, partial [Brevibacterium sp.]|nr:cytochrome c oxidase subunit 4 [Brevibacterium sp.]
MKSSITLFMVNSVFFVVVSIIYGLYTNFSEMVGFPALLLTGGMSGMIGVYLWLTDRRVGRQPQDAEQAEISDADADYGFFSPWSWWPIA